MQEKELKAEQIDEAKQIIEEVERCELVRCHLTTVVKSVSKWR